MFLGERLSDILDDCFSVHEPDILHVVPQKTWSAHLADTFRKVRSFGLYHMLIGRVLGKSGTRALAYAYLSGRLSEKQLIDRIHQARDAYIAGRSERVFIEACHQWYPVLGPLQQAYPAARMALVVRDPRTWIMSFLNWGGRHDSRDWVEKLRAGRITPDLVRDAEFASEWPEMSAFEKIAWDWRFIYRQLARQAQKNRQARIFRFEDLFDENADPETRTDFLEHIAGRTPRPGEVEALNVALANRINSSKQGRLDAWRTWRPERARALERTCGQGMRELGYGSEPEWARLLAGDAVRD
jgi:hypothetical protein